MFFVYQNWWYWYLYLITCEILHCYFTVHICLFFVLSSLFSPLPYVVYSNPEACCWNFVLIQTLNVLALTYTMHQTCNFCFPIKEGHLLGEKDFHVTYFNLPNTFTMLLLERLTPLLVARSWHKTSVEGILSKQPENQMRILPSPYLCLPLMSIIKIARWVQIPAEICRYS